MNICPICRSMYWDGPYPHKCAPVWVAVTIDEGPTDGYIDLERETQVTVRAHAADDAAEQAAQQLDDNESEGPSESRFIGVIEQTELEDLKHQLRANIDALIPTFSFEWFDVAGEVSITYRARSVPT